MNLISESELMQVTGYKRRGDLETCLRRQGVRVYYGKDGRLFVPSSEFERVNKPEPAQEVKLL